MREIREGKEIRERLETRDSLKSRESREIREIRYTVLDPTGNITILAESPVPAEEQPSVAGNLMALEPDAEQTGFLSAGENGPVMRMAGGEFCGNAAMSAAVLYAADQGIREGTVRVAVSGTPEPVAVEVSALPDGSMRGVIAMPLPVSIREEQFPDGRVLPVVHFVGISHVIMETAPDRAEAEKLVREWCSFLKAESLGLMMLDRDAGRLTPLVYVPGAGTLFWENACASGTTAVGAYLADKEGIRSLSLHQPGGTLQVEKTADGKLLLTGTVRIRYKRTARIPV